MTFEDLKELGDEEAVKKAGKLRQQGKKYVVQDADVIFFKVIQAKLRYRYVCSSRLSVFYVYMAEVLGEMLRGGEGGEFF